MDAALFADSRMAGPGIVIRNILRALLASNALKIGRTSNLKRAENVKQVLIFASKLRFQNVMDEENAQDVFPAVCASYPRSFFFFFWSEVTLVPIMDHFSKRCLGLQVDLRGLIVPG